MHQSTLVRLRKASKLSQAAIAKQVGVQQGTVARWEKGTRRIGKAHEDMLKKILVNHHADADQLAPKKAEKKPAKARVSNKP